MKNHDAQRIIARQYVQTNVDGKSAYESLKKGFPNIPAELFIMLWNERDADKDKDKETDNVIRTLSRYQTVVEDMNAKGYKVIKVKKDA